MSVQDWFVNSIIQAIQAWYTAHLDSDSGPENGTFLTDQAEDSGLPGAVWEKKWSVRRVVEQIRRVEITEIIGANQKDERFWREYSKTVTGIIENLDSETYQKYEQMAQRWNNMGPPPEIQKK